MIPGRRSRWKPRPPSPFLCRESGIWPAGYRRERFPPILCRRSAEWATQSFADPSDKVLGDAENFCVAHQDFGLRQEFLCSPKSFWATWKVSVSPIGNSDGSKNFCVAQKLSVSLKSSLCRPKVLYVARKDFRRRRAAIGDPENLGTSQDPRGGKSPARLGPMNLRSDRRAARRVARFQPGAERSDSLGNVREPCSVSICGLRKGKPRGVGATDGKRVAGVIPPSPGGPGVRKAGRRPVRPGVRVKGRGAPMNRASRHLSGGEG
jgi:hypothetical protein